MVVGVVAGDGEEPWGLTLRRVRPNRSSLSVMENIRRGLGESLGATWQVGIKVFTDRSKEGLEDDEAGSVRAEFVPVIIATGTRSGKTEEASTIFCLLSRRLFTVMPVF